VGHGRRLPFVERTFLDRLVRLLQEAEAPPRALPERHPSAAD